MNTAASTAKQSLETHWVKASHARLRGAERLVAGRRIFLTIVAALLLFPSTASAANWSIIQGTEEPFPERRLAWYGFVQPLYEAIIADEVTGLGAPALEPYNGRPMVLNTLGAGDTQSTFSIRRARLGLRGRAPGAMDLVSYHLSLEAGQNAVTSGGAAPTLMDATATLSTPWGPRFRFGQFRLPLADESQEAVHVTSDTINASFVVPRLLLERPVQGGVVSGNAYGYRDIGIEVFDAPRIGDIELGYSAFVSNGRKGSFDYDQHVDVGGRLMVTWLLDERQFHAEREELAFAVWGMTGKRTPEAGVTEDRHRAGTFAQLRLKPLRIRAEFVWGDGVIPGGPAPPFRGNPVGLLADSTAYGGTFLTSVRVFEWLEANFELDAMVLSPGSGPAERVFQRGVLGVQFFASPHAKLAINGALRRVDGPDAPADVQRILHSVGPRLSAQATVRF